jgi:hypothetical protein
MQLRGEHSPEQVPFKASFLIKKEGWGQVAVGEIAAWKNNCFFPIRVVASEEVKKGPRTL